MRRRAELFKINKYINIVAIKTDRLFVGNIWKSVNVVKSALCGNSNMEIKELYRAACSFPNKKITCILNSFQYLKWRDWIGDNLQVSLSPSIKFHFELSACSKQIYLCCTVIWIVSLISSSSKCRIFPSVAWAPSCRTVTHKQLPPSEGLISWITPWGWSTSGLRAARYPCT